jgi:hypothetical protein
VVVRDPLTLFDRKVGAIPSGDRGSMEVSGRSSDWGLRHGVGDENRTRMTSLEDEDPRSPD